MHTATSVTVPAGLYFYPCSSLMAVSLFAHSLHKSHQLKSRAFLAFSKYTSRKLNYPRLPDVLCCTVYCTIFFVHFAAYFFGILIVKKITVSVKLQFSGFIKHL
jgi:hypothetical protein